MTSKISIGLVAILVTAITIPTAFAMVNPTDEPLDTGCNWEETDLKRGSDGNCKIKTTTPILPPMVLPMNNTFEGPDSLIENPLIERPKPIERTPLIEFTAKIDKKQHRYYDGDVILISGTVDKSIFANETIVYVEALNGKREPITVKKTGVEDDNTFSVGIKIDKSWGNMEVENTKSVVNKKGKSFWENIYTKYYLIVSYGPVGTPIELDYQIRS